MTTVTSSLGELADEYWQAYLAFSPVSATSIGDRRFDDRMDDPSPEAIDAYRGRLAGFREQVESIDPAALDGADAVTRSALIAQIASDVAGLETGLEQWAVDPLEGPQVIALDLEAIQPIANAEQARAMVDRWHALGPWLDEHAANVRRGLASGRVAVRTPVARAVDQIDEILRRPDAELPLLKPLAVEHPDWPAADREAFAEGLRSAVAGVIRPALERYGAVVRDEILPAARPDERAGVLHVEGGQEAYRKLIRVHTSLDLSPDEIHRIGLDEVARIDAELAELGGRVLGTADSEAIRSRLRSDPALHFASRDDVFATAEDALGRARAAIPQWFGLLPAAECVVVRMGEHEEKHSTIAYYRQPAVDGSRPGQYYVNTYAPETRPRYEAEALAYHESIPGHHLQIAIGQELTDLPEFRKHLGPTAFFEGWGLYTERLSDEMGLYSGDLDRIGILSFDGWRACRLVVDTGIHALGWSRQRAIDFMTAHTALAANNIANEIDRYIVWPGQALAYKIGQLEILRLRAEARAAAGRGFDIRAFHDAVLGHGAVGLETLREVVSSGPAFGKVDAT
ncbi:MAG TPA: DUF885 domain-containing protein [Candidatus Limnocylindrales bacterium]|jgi:uncharacterized protein (DUF885 family)|nr:DUF885 domain-containing protein [Candidatus Limnocylindrales bacterium]